MPSSSITGQQTLITEEAGDLEDVISSLRISHLGEARYLPDLVGVDEPTSSSRGRFGPRYIHMIPGSEGRTDLQQALCQTGATRGIAVRAVICIGGKSSRAGYVLPPPQSKIGVGGSCRPKGLMPSFPLAARFPALLDVQ